MKISNFRKLSFAFLPVIVFVSSCADDPSTEISELNGTWSTGCSANTIQTYQFEGSKVLYTVNLYNDATCSNLNLTGKRNLTITSYGATNSTLQEAKNIDVKIGTSDSCPVNTACTSSSQDVGQISLGVYKIEEIDKNTHRLSLQFSDDQLSPPEQVRPTGFENLTYTRTKPVED
ncbi:MAG: hypothetical protein A3K03_09965 [Bdellovibrionales bacterium RIFOXYD1_FULL_44_7]|nr:MAG: hypothetical protein A3K03_09965 [Bdellovibrionales bacterium RIFOXYD1_FULL_44_7]